MHLLNRVGRVLHGAQLRQHLQDTVQMCEPRTESIDEFIQHEFPVEECLFVFRHFAGQAVEELRLNAAQRGISQIMV